MAGDDDDSGLIGSVVLPTKSKISSNEEILDNDNSSTIDHEQEYPDVNKGIFVHPAEDQPVFENQTSVQDIVEEIKLLKNKYTIISQTMLDISKFVMPNDRDGIFIESFEPENDSVNNTIMENTEGSSYIEENACQ
jgi:hypothetical protein